jgi:hypothetical protein
MDPASQALAQGFRLDVRRTYAAISEQSNVPLSTLHHRAQGRLSKQETAQRRQYLTPEEEKAVVNFLLLMCALRQPVRIKFVPSLAFGIVRQRSTSNKPTKPPGKNWAWAFEKRHLELKARTVRPIDWKHHGNNIHRKITQ